MRFMFVQTRVAAVKNSLQCAIESPQTSFIDKLFGYTLLFGLAPSFSAHSLMMVVTAANIDSKP
jgi:hypothetical protein